MSAYRRAANPIGSRRDSAAGLGALRNRWIVIAAWALVAALLLARTILQFGTVPLYGDSDDAMRMVTATDLLDGQGWQDNVERRDNTPFGAEVTWSRLVDAPIALLMAAARPFSASLAPDVAAIVWPLILLLPLLALCAAIVRRLIPEADRVTALAVPLISLVLLIEFLPGRVDHHSVQILLMLSAVLVMVVWRDRIRGGLLLGLILATSIAIGVETLPFLAAAIATMVILWTREPDRYWAATVACGVTLAVATLIHFLIAVAPARYGVQSCDALSITYVGALGLGGLTLATVAALAAPLRHPEARITAMIVAGGVLATVLAVTFPGCITGPYGGIDQRILEMSFGGIAEAQPLWRRLMEDPATGVAFALPALAAVAVSVKAVLSARGEKRVDWLIVTAFLFVAVVTMLFVMRGARFAAAFSVPAAAYLIGRARSYYIAKPALGTPALIGSWLLFAGVLQFAVVGWLFPRTTSAMPSPLTDVACFRAADYAELATFPPRKVMAPIRIGSHILRYTKHSIVSAGFHRNTDGTHDVLDFFGGDEATARAIAERRSIDIVVDCGNAYAGTLTEYEWLRALPNPGALSFYAVNLED